MLAIHFGDHNLNDRYFEVPEDKARAILLDASLTPEQRQSAIWKLAAEEGTTESDPRMSQLDNADLFLPWPSQALGFITPEEWQRDLDQWFAENEE